MTEETGTRGPLFDYAAEQAKRDALGRVEANAPMDWKTAARLAVIRVAQTRAEFIAADVADEIARCHPTAKTHEPRALGAVMRWAARVGMIEATGRVRPCGRASQHNTPVAIWRSRIARDGGVLT